MSRTKNSISTAKKVGYGRRRHQAAIGVVESRPGYSCKLTQIAVRFPRELFEDLKAEATERKLSFSSVVVLRLGGDLS